jgi:hypothetical protein
MIVNYVRKTFTVLATGERYNIQHNDTQQKTIFPKDNRQNNKSSQSIVPSVVALAVNWLNVVAPFRILERCSSAS